MSITCVTQVTRECIKRVGVLVGSQTLTLSYYPRNDKGSVIQTVHSAAPSACKVTL